MNIASRASIAQGFLVMLVNPLRTSLSTLGVVIGIGAVIATLALADGLDQYIRAQISAQTDVQSITISSRTSETRDGFSYPTRRYPVFTTTDALELQRYLGSTVEVTMSVGGQAVVATPTAAPHVVSVTGALSNYLSFSRKDIFAGRFFTDGESSHGSSVVVLSYKLATELSPSRDAEMMVGHEVRVRGRSLTTVGVMPPYTGENSFAIIIPVRGAATTLGAHEQLTPALLVRAPSIESVDATRAAAEEWLATRYRDWERQVSVTTPLARLEQAKSAMMILKLVFGALAGISLVVGGVGIMNVLLASVAERTREIGVRKALGARQRDILYQFLAESVAIASVGSAIGTVVGLVAAFTLAAIVRWQVPGAKLYAAITIGTILTSVISAATIGLTFGTFPALRAARLSPIDAIRHD